MLMGPAGDRVSPGRMNPFSHYRCRRILLFSLLLTLMTATPGVALQPGEILILANRRLAESVDLARYYARRRNIPDEHLLLLDVPTGERCSRDVYEQRIADPVRQYLAAVTPAWRIRCLVLMYGLPLTVTAGPDADRETLRLIEDREAALKALLDPNAPEPAADRPAELAAELEDVRRRLNSEKVRADTVASVDSELCVVRVPDPPIGGWIENPFCVAHRNHSAAISRDAVIMTARLDGPTPASVRRMIDDAIRVEATGLSGVAYFDARWPDRPSSTPSAYHLYDRAIHRAARRVADSGRMPVVVDADSGLFRPGRCPNAALYCGWYSLKQYVDAFEWQPGAVGYHIASGECTTLKKKGSQVWCKRMIEEGVCATIGPVGEPYVQAFPMPDQFFGFLTEGILSLAECYMVSLPFLSWKMVLIGDPLYRPF
jgi:uncharacterized protein (TIGR03790 family)